MSDSTQLRVVVFKDGDLWVAQCLEYDIGAQAPDLDSLRNRLNMAIQVDLETSLEKRGEPFAGIEPAPPYFHEMWSRSAHTSGFKAESSLTRHGNRGVTVDLALCA